MTAFVKTLIILIVVFALPVIVAGAILFGLFILVAAWAMK